MKLATTNSPVGAPTIALKSTNAPFGTASPTAPALSSAKTGVLPKATVALNPPTQPLSPMGAATRPLGAAGAATRPLSPSASAATTVRSSTLSAVEQEAEESGASGFLKILSGVGCLAACTVLGLQLKMSNIWLTDDEFPKKGQWMAIFDPVE